MAQQNNAKATLQSASSVGDTLLTLVDTPANFVSGVVLAIQIDDGQNSEQLPISSISSNSVTTSRGAKFTHAAGASVRFIVAAKDSGAALQQNALSLPGLLTLLTAESTAAGTVTTIPDSGPGGTTVTQATAGKRASSVTLTSGEQVIRFVAATPTYYSAQLHLSLTNKFSVVARLALNSLGANDNTDKNILGMNGAVSALLQVYVSSTDAVSMFQRNDAGTVQISAGTTDTITDTAEHCLAWIRDNDFVTFVIDGKHKRANVGALTEPNWTASTVGAANSAGDNPMNGDMNTVAVCREVISPSDYRKAYRVLMGMPCARIICSGNSITAGQGASDAAHYYPQLLAGILNASGVYARAITNLGHSGYQTSQLISGFQGEAQALICPYSETVAILWEATNAIYNGADAATTVSQVWKWCKMYRANGAKVIVPNIVARGNFTSQASMSAIAVQANALLSAQWRNNCDGFIDLAATFSNYNDTSIYDADKCHLNDAGYAIVAQKVADAIHALLD